MIKQKRLTRIETSLTPKQVVLLWLRQEHHGRTSMEYLRDMLQQAPSELEFIKLCDKTRCMQTS